MDLIISFFSIFGIFFISNYIEKKYLKENNIIVTIFIFTFIIGILYSLLIYLFILKINTKFFCIFILLVSSLLGIYNFTYFFNIKKIKFFINKQNYLFYIVVFILFLFFLSSILPPSDLDSLRYHLEIPKKIINNKFYEYITLDYTYLGANEFINLFGLNFNFENTSSLLNFLYLLFLVISNIYIFEKYKVGSNNIGNLIVLSSPYLVSLISTQKIYFLSCFIIIYSLTYLILKGFKVKFEIHQLIGSLSIFSIALKSVFLPYALIIFLFQIYLLRNDYKKIFYLLLTYVFFVFLFILPILILKFKLFGNPLIPFLDFFEINKNWLDEFKFFLIKYDNPLNIYSLIFFPIKLILPLTFNTFEYTQGQEIIYFGKIYFEYGNIFKLIGLGTLGIFFLKNKNKVIYIYLFLLMLSFFLIGNLQNRWFFPLLIFISIFYNTNNFFHKYFKKAILLQSLFIIITLLFISNISLKAKFFNKESVLNSMAYGYEFSKKIEKEYPGTTIATFLEGYYYLENYLPLFKHELIIKHDKDYFSNYLKKNQMFVLVYQKKLNLDEIRSVFNIKNIVILNTKTYNELFASRFPLKKFEKTIYLYELIFK